jgi:hypothetical protein
MESSNLSHEIVAKWRRISRFRDSRNMSTALFASPDPSTGKPRFTSVADRSPARGGASHSEWDREGITARDLANKFQVVPVSHLLAGG